MKPRYDLHRPRRASSYGVYYNRTPRPRVRKRQVLLAIVVWVLFLGSLHYWATH